MAQKIPEVSVWLAMTNLILQGQQPQSHEVGTKNYLWFMITSYGLHGKSKEAMGFKFHPLLPFQQVNMLNMLYSAPCSPASVMQGILQKFVIRLVVPTTQWRIAINSFRLEGILFDLKVDHA